MRKTVWNLEDNSPATNWDGTKPLVDKYGFGHIKDLVWFHAGDDTDEREYWFIVGQTRHRLKVFDRRQKRRFRRMFKKSNARVSGAKRPEHGIVGTLDQKDGEA